MVPLMSIVAGVCFGVWQQSASAGAWMYAIYLPAISALFDASEQWRKEQNRK